MKIINKLLTYALTLAALVLAGLALLYICGRLPQQPIADNLSASLYQFKADQESPHPSDVYRWSDLMDVYSEQLMLTHAFYMNTREDPASVVANPGYLRDDESTYQGFVDMLEASAQPNYFYQRYWMGFRVYLRLGLSLFTYQQLRRINMIVILLLFSLAILRLSQRTRGSLLFPMLLALSFVLCNPFVILETFHSGACFAIAFGGVAFLPRKEKRFLTWPMYFFLLGALTQYFDFYTAPLITCLLPLTALLLTRRYDSDCTSTSRGMFALAGKCLLSWLAAYVLLWVCKMAATTALTDFNAFADAFGSLAFRLGLGFDRELSGLSYDPSVALARCFAKLLLDNLAVTLAVLAVVTLACFVAFLLRKNRMARFCDAAVFLCLALIPVVWIAASAQLSIIHARFQYRNLAGFLFAYASFLAVALGASSASGPAAPPRIS